jgi:hypothetical protein
VLSELSTCPNSPKSQLGIPITKNALESLEFNRTSPREWTRTKATTSTNKVYNLRRSVKRPRELVLPTEASLALTARALLQYTKVWIPYSVRLWRPFLGAVDALPGRSWLVVNNISTFKVDPRCFSQKTWHWMTLIHIVIVITFIKICHCAQEDATLMIQVVHSLMNPAWRS